MDGYVCEESAAGGAGRRSVNARVVPRFFASAAEFRSWLEAHHDSATELVVGFHRVDTGTPCMTWTESVREALCFGWIDGLVKRIDDTTYQRRYTPRKARSVWSAVNVRHVSELIAEGLMQPSGRAAFASRGTAHEVGYSLKGRSAEMPEPYASLLTQHRTAHAFWNAQPKSYRQAVVWHIVSAKRDATRARRFQSLVDYASRGERLPQYDSTK